MIDLFTSPASLPFAIALTVVAALFVLEIISALIGGTILGAGSDGPDLDMDVDTDFDLSIEPDMDIEVEAATDAVDTSELSGGLFTWIGARDVPFLIWLVSFLTMFGLSGLILQSAVEALTGGMLPATVAVIIAIVPALAVTRILANWVALLMPKTETTALRARHLGGYHGTITQGTARRGKPAEVKIKDRHGNIHYLRISVTSLPWTNTSSSCSGSTRR
ncbi:MAG: YqiJ family protein [Pseudomonadota bacterium]